MMYSILRKTVTKSFSQRCLSASVISIESGSKVSLMGTNAARASTLKAIEKDDAQAVRLASIPQDAHSSTVTAYLQKNTPEGANVQEVLQHILHLFSILFLE